MYDVEAPPFVVQLFFQTKNGNGFSETYWVDAENYDNAMDIVLNGAGGGAGLLDTRRALFTDKHKIIYIRVSDATETRDTIVRMPDETDGKGTYVPAAGDTEADETALLIRINGTENNLPFFDLKPIRLLPEEVCTDDVYTPTANWNTAWDAFVDELKSNYKAIKGPADNPTDADIDSVQALHLTRRKVGRPFGHSAGRTRTP